ncbi:hypothetical protein Q5P01_011814 [Channa striata]|uniref:Secreted protein n=1 Tax=Channa striata TaxID=64152 RepID=A0AA88SNA4_CHASR|nr:hypothetical protein Q5P01_011814 [Channa striata]
MLDAARMTLGLSVMFGAALGSVGGSSEVRKVSSSYSCCGSPTISFDQHCEHTWSLHDMPIAHSSTGGCVFPCRSIGGGAMTLHTCTDLNATVTCTDEVKVIGERSVQYYGRRCSGNKSNEAAPGKHGSAGLLLVAAAVTGRFGTC